MLAFGARSVLLIEFCLAALLIGSLALLPASFASIRTVAFLLGIVVQGAQAGLNALVAAFYPTPIRSTGVGWALGIGRIGSIIGPILGGLMLSFDWRLQQIFLAGTMPALCAALAILLSMRLRPLGAAPSSPTPIEP